MDLDKQEQARRLMRAGLSDEAIEVKTGLDALDILELRAGASVEESAKGPPRRSKDEPRPAGA